MPQPANVESRETWKFSGHAAGWWDPGGPMRSLHAVNPLRVRFITRACPVRGRKAVDVGCGGGLLAESLTQLGASVTGIDMSQELLDLARFHAADSDLKIEYRLMTAEALADEHPASFDVVACMEVLEHIPRPQEVIAACAHLLKPGGHAFFSTIDRNLKSLLFAIFGAEFVLHLLPIGSHNYAGLIRPAELRRWAEASGLVFVEHASLTYNLLTRQFSLAPHLDVNYMMHFTRS